MDPTIIRSLRYSSHGYQIDPPARIHPNILIGAGEMLTPRFVKQYGITHVINCAQEKDSPSWFKLAHTDRYHCIDAKDTLDSNILKWYPEFKQTMKYFLQNLLCGTVFVHCQCGINRSAFLALMFVCDAFHYPHDNTVISILKQRPCALTNPSFQRQVADAVNNKVTF
jgi:hypothetical protein